MKKLLEKQIVFNSTLRLLAFLSRQKAFTKLTFWATKQAAQLNIFLNKPKPTNKVDELAKTWQQLMPPDGQKYFPIEKITEDTAYTQIHLRCPLRGTGDVEACHKLMNYDRQLMKKIGGELIVLESQSNSGKNYCRLAIRPKGQDLSDLIPAYEKAKSNE